uniref:Uncharacterized protein n=1 Tax=Panagrolaimus sp. PS1159 TaxID=55785 RepID=A0AC35GXX7_9BILA
MMQKLCSCWQKSDQNDERKPGVSFRTKAKSEGIKNRKTIPPSSESSSNTKQSEPSRSSLTFGFNFRKKQKTTAPKPNRELPSIPGKKTFSRNLPAIDDMINPTYESIDAENDSISDPLYSKVDENPASQRYDYPTFRTKIIASTSAAAAAAAKQRKLPSNTEEPLYTSASQIYSGGSEDPYSSIVSESGGPSTARRAQQNVRFDDNNSSIYDPGYARVKDPPTKSSIKDPGPSNSTREIPLNIDQLYAKINRPSVRRPRSSHDDIPDSGADIPGPSTSSFRPTVVSFAPQDLSQNNESGSGSVVSGSSANPSYRYLTVRETVDVVRERIRQRQATNQSEATDRSGGGGGGGIREHYYSTIANDYETVGGGSLNDSIYGVAIPVVNAAARTASPLTLNVGRLSGIFEGTPPRPPTSPIPNRQPPQQSSSTISRPIVIPSFPSTSNRMSTSLIGPTRILTSPTTTAATMGDEKANSNPNLASSSHHRTTTRITETVQNVPTFLNSWHSQTAASAAANNRILFPRGNPRIIPPVSTNNTATVFTTTSIKSQDSFQSQRSIDTPVS